VWLCNSDLGRRSCRRRRNRMIRVGRGVISGNGRMRSLSRAGRGRRGMLRGSMRRRQYGSARRHRACDCRVAIRFGEGIAMGGRGVRGQMWVSRRARLLSRGALRRLAQGRWRPRECGHGRERCEGSFFIRRGSGRLSLSTRLRAADADAEAQRQRATLGMGHGCFGPSFFCRRDGDGGLACPPGQQKIPQPAEKPKALAIIPPTVHLLL
jgi:hypothetical protein